MTTVTSMSLITVSNAHLDGTLQALLVSKEMLLVIVWNGRVKHNVRLVILGTLSIRLGLSVRMVFSMMVIVSISKLIMHKVVRFVPLDFI